MYLLRTAFWISVVILCLPIGAEDHTEVNEAGANRADVSASDTIGAALSTVGDLAGLCERQPEVCETGSAVWHTFQRKARYGASLIYDWASSDDETATGAQDPEPQLRESNAAHSDAYGSELRATASAPLPEHTGSIIRIAGSTKSQNTLKIEDLIPQWTGPNGKART